MYDEDIKAKARALREEGNEYSHIIKALDLPISKSTLAGWLKGISIPENANKKIQEKRLEHLRKARELSLASKARVRKEYFFVIDRENQHLAKTFTNKDTAKISLAMLYLAEGAKRDNGALVFGNSSPFIISIYLYLLRKCYSIDEKKFRCTVQCRADQDINELQSYWHKITGIPLSQFNKAQIDFRTTGRRTAKKEYKGVCRIDYFSARIFHAIMSIPKVVFLGR